MITSSSQVSNTTYWPCCVSPLREGVCKMEARIISCVRHRTFLSSFLPFSLSGSQDMVTSRQIYCRLSPFGPPAPHLPVGPSRTVRSTPYSASILRRLRLIIRSNKCILSGAHRTQEPACLTHLGTLCQLWIGAVATFVISGCSGLLVSRCHKSTLKCLPTALLLTT